MKLLQDLLSRDPQRIWSASGTILRSWDRDLPNALSKHLPEIRTQTADIDLGGAFHPNSVHLKNAILRIEFVREGAGCLCALYANDKFSNPSQEEEAGHVKILETLLTEDGYVDHYVCECLFCQAKYDVIEREYHYTWWGWSPSD